MGRDLARRLGKIADELEADREPLEEAVRRTVPESLGAVRARLSRQVRELRAIGREVDLMVRR